MAGNRVISAILTLRDRNFGTTAANAANSARDLGRRVTRTGNMINRFGRSATSSFASVAKGAFGMAAAYVGVSAIKDLGVGMIESAASASAMSAQFSTVFGDMEGAAAKSLEGIATETNALSGRLKGSFLGIAAFAKTSGMDTAAALALTERATLAAADGAAFYDKSVDDVSESLQSFLKGNFANDAALGISATETTRNAAANKLYGKSFKDLAEDQKQMTLLQMVEDGNKLSGALGQAAREGDGFENVMGNMKESWEMLKVKFGTPILEPVVKSIKFLTSAMLNFNTDNIINGFSKFGKTAKNALKVIEPGLIWLKDNAIKGVKKAVDLLGTGVLVLKDWAIDAFQNIKQRIEENKPALESVKGVMQDVGTKALELKDWMLNAFESAKPALSWLKDEGLPLVVDGIASVIEKATETFNYIKDNWSLISPVVYGVAGAILFYKTGMVVAALATKGMTLATTAMSIAQGAFNAVLLISPLGWFAIAIGAVIAAGVLLYKNWDTIKATAQSLWDKTKEVGVGIQDAFSSAFNAVKTAASDSMNFVIDKINGLIEAINKVPGVKIPIIAQVEWGQAEAPKGMAGLKGIDSYAVGTNQVKRDMVANIHKDEMIIPAAQSRNLRKQGVTIDNIGSGGPVRSASTGSAVQSQGALLNMIAELIQTIKNMPKGDVNVEINGTNLTVMEIVNELIPILKLRLANM